MTTPAPELRTLLRRVSRRAADDPDSVLPVLRLLAGDAAYPDDAESLHEIATEINAARVARLRRNLIESALPTDAVLQLLGVSRQALAQRRARGGLLGARIGPTTYYPAWQFGPTGVASGLDRLLALLPRDAWAADDLMRTPHTELDGRSLADVFAAGEWDVLEAWLGDVAGWRD